MQKCKEIFLWDCIVKKRFKGLFTVKVLVAYPVSLHALHSNNSETSNANTTDFVERVCNSEQQL